MKTLMIITPHYGVDTNKNLLNVSGTVTGLSGSTVNILSFIIVSGSSIHYPGLEFTIFFKNIPSDRITSTLSSLTIGITADENINAIFPYIFSSPLPVEPALNIIPSITFKSDGQKFRVVSGGPAGWLSRVVLSMSLSY